MSDDIKYITINMIDLYNTISFEFRPSYKHFEFDEEYSISDS